MLSIPILASFQSTSVHFSSWDVVDSAQLKTLEQAMRLQGTVRAAAHMNTWCTAACLKQSPMNMALKASQITKIPNLSSSSKL